MRHLATFGVAPPADKRDRVQTGRFLKALMARALIGALILWALLVALGATPLILIPAGIPIVLLALDLLWLTYRVRRDERGRAGARP